ncbi:uncharacterized protein KD926_001988 [Aspergillus affinis]|uniref:uncharacterized protein n=1 Tax=Aspergillus affinis TaxID=1070780 RepID=UPI0022FE638E|nr:uncharacterized protein KD926_001988 [Aspergillus affinis]KAI9044164.1 hypothetical protein KD926_001988 [Aspergillus affinis]
MLCQQCRRMFQAPEWATHHADVASLSEAAASGCSICHPFMQQLVQKYGNPEDVFVNPMSYRVYQDETQAQIVLDLDFSRDGNDVLECQSLMAIPSETVTFNPTIRERRSSLPLQDAVIAAKGWLTDCQEGHSQRCRKNTQPAFYPDYLLEIDGSTVRLISPTDKEISGPYVAVSYCRGSYTSFLQLSTSTMAQLQNSISLSELPVAFREAAELVQGLFIRYLWIDALCLNPDSKNSEDQVQHTFTNCLFNLALARSKTPDESCLGACPLHAKLPFQVDTTGLIGEDKNTNITAIAVPWDYFENSLYHQPLAYRSDSVQERFWSPRVLSFGLGELFWSCAQLSNASESLPRGPGHLAEEFGLTQKAIPDSSDPEKLGDFWWKILEEYTDGELDCPEAGRLAGVSTIGSQLALSMNDLYVHGHFAKMLPWSLNWRVEVPPLEDRRGVRRARKIDAAKHTTPSWSWGSMDGTLYFFRLRECTNLAEIVNLSSLSETGSSKLAITTFCMEVDWTDGTPVIQHEFWREDSERFHWLQVDLDDERFTPKPGARHLLAALIEDDWLGKWEGLLVEEVSAGGESSYKRIGHYILDRKQGDEKREQWKEDFRLMSGERQEIVLV